MRPDAPYFILLLCLMSDDFLVKEKVLLRNGLSQQAASPNTV